MSEEATATERRITKPGDHAERSESSHRMVDEIGPAVSIFTGSTAPVPMIEAPPTGTRHVSRKNEVVGV